MSFKLKELKYVFLFLFIISQIYIYKFIFQFFHDVFNFDKNKIEDPLRELKSSNFNFLVF